MFLFYLIVSVTEWALWLWYILENKEDQCKELSGFWWFNFWAKWIGLYGSAVLYFLCFLMPVLQLQRLNGVTTAAGWTNGVL